MTSEPKKIAWANPESIKDYFYNNRWSWGEGEDKDGYRVHYSDGTEAWVPADELKGQDLPEPPRILALLKSF